MPHENSEPIEYAHPRSLIWNSLSVEKKVRRNMTAVHRPHENSEYPYEPAHPPSLIWNSLSAEKVRRNMPAVPTQHDNCEYPYEPAHPRSLIWTLLSVGKRKTKNKKKKKKKKKKKRYRSVRAVTTPHENSEYPFRDNTPANMYIWDPYGQNLGIYPIRVLHGPHIGFFCPYKTYIGPILVNFDQQTRIYGNHMGRFGAFIPFGSYLGPI